MEDGALCQSQLKAPPGGAGTAGGQPQSLRERGYKSPSDSLWDSAKWKSPDRPSPPAFAEPGPEDGGICHGRRRFRGGHRGTEPPGHWLAGSAVLARAGTAVPRLVPPLGG